MSSISDEEHVAVRQAVGGVCGGYPVGPVDQVERNATTSSCGDLVAGLADWGTLSLKLPAPQVLAEDDHVGIGAQEHVARYVGEQRVELVTTEEEPFELPPRVRVSAVRDRNCDTNPLHEFGASAFGDDRIASIERGPVCEVSANTVPLRGDVGAVGDGESTEDVLEDVLVA